jgi:hypothetical protein
VEIGGGSAARKRIYLAFGIAALVAATACGGVYFYLQSLHSKQEDVTPIRPIQSSNIASTSIASNPAPAAMRKPPPDPWHGLKPSKVTLEKTDSSLIYAIGILTNDTTRQRFGVKVELDVLDGHRQKLGTATDYIEVIEPGKEWKFRALVTAKAVTSAKLTKVKEQE